MKWSLWDVTVGPIEFLSVPARTISAPIAGDGKLPIDRLVRHYSRTAIKAAVADMLAGNTIEAVLQIDNTHC